MSSAPTAVSISTGPVPNVTAAGVPERVCWRSSVVVAATAVNESASIRWRSVVVPPPPPEGSVMSVSNPLRDRKRSTEPDSVGAACGTLPKPRLCCVVSSVPVKSIEGTVRAPVSVPPIKRR